MKKIHLSLHLPIINHLLNLALKSMECKSIILNLRVIGTDKRKPLDQQEKTPSPAVYDVDKAAHLNAHKSQFCKIGNETRSKHFTDNPEKSPGPAVYDKRTFVEENDFKKKGFSCRNKTKDLIALEISKTPGPGTY